MMINNLHSYWAYLVLSMLIVTVIIAIYGFFSKKEYTHLHFRLGLLTLIGVHLQLLLGIVLYLFEGRYANLGTAMKVPEARLLALEHPVMMLLAIILITMGWSKHKKKVKSNDKFKIIAIFYGIALILILSRIPWGNWF